MNRHFVPPVSPERLAKMAEERAAFRSLALSQKRRSWEYRNWALEAEKAGRLDDYRRFRAESDRLRRDARDHLDLARRR